jgi:glycosyltransferase involved in cell wall biosynthesis
MIIIVSISLIIHCAFYLIIFSHLASYKEKTKSQNYNRNKLTLVICYFNEEENIETFLPEILKQKVDEVILVDDNSSDNTLAKLKKHKSERIKVLHNGKPSPGKKLALSMGIENSKNGDILLTDADCQPASENWSLHMSNSSSKIVLGYGPMQKVKGFVGVFSRFETYITALQYLSYSIMGIPYMGVGRNMKIEKALVVHNKEKVRGAKLASGDDDLMINALANMGNTSICIHPESFVYSPPKKTIGAFLNQKCRHISTSIYYRHIHKVLLGLFSGTQILFHIGLIFVLVAGTISIKVALLLLLVKWTVQQTIHYRVMTKLEERDLLWKAPFLDVIFFVYLLVLPSYYFINKNKSHWS